MKRTKDFCAGEIELPGKKLTSRHNKIMLFIDINNQNTNGVFKQEEVGQLKLYQQNFLRNTHLQSMAKG